jgi:hypothetical protein
MYKLIDTIKYSLFLFGLSFHSGSLVLTSQFLDLVLEVLLGLSVSDNLRLLNDTLFDESVLGLKLSKGVFGAVDKTKSSGSITTEFGSQSEDDNLFQRRVELLGDLLL